MVEITITFLMARMEMLLFSGTGIVHLSVRGVKEKQLILARRNAGAIMNGSGWKGNR